MASLMSLTVVDLKNKLRERGLKLSGKKAELVERLVEDGYEMDETVSATSPGNKRGPKAKTPEEDLKNALIKANLSFADAIKVMTEIYDFPVLDYCDKNIVDDLESSLPQKVESPKAKTPKKTLKVISPKKTKKTLKVISPKKTKSKAKSPKVEVDLDNIPDDEEDLEELKVADLKAILKAKGAKTAGKKAELIERILELQEAEQSEDGSSEDEDSEEGEDESGEVQEEGEVENGEVQEEGEVEDGEVQQDESNDLPEVEVESTQEQNDETTEEM